MFITVLFLGLLLVWHLGVLSRKKYLFSLFGIFVFPWMMFIPFNLFFADLEPIGLLYVGTSLLCFSISFLGGYKLAPQLRGLPADRYSQRFIFIKFILYTTISIGFANNIYLLNAVGNLSFDIQKMFSSAHSFSLLRNVDQVGLPVLSRIANVYCFFGLYILASYFFEHHLVFKRTKFFYLVPVLLTFVLEALITGIKGYILYALFYCLAAFVIVYRVNFDNCKKRKVLLEFAFIFLCVFCVSAISLLLKRNLNITFYGIIEKLFTSYLFLPSSAFVVWFNNNFKDNFTNFTNFSNLLMGITIYVQGLAYEFKRQVYTNVYLLGDEFHTNVYLAFKDIILDVGVFGSFLFISVVGFWGGVIEKFVLNRNIFLVPVYTAFALFLLNFTFGSWFKYLSNILTLFLISIYFLLAAIKVAKGPSSR